MGTGLVALPLTELGHAVLGVDLSPKMIASARERIGARVAIADATAAPVAADVVRRRGRRPDHCTWSAIRPRCSPKPPGSFDPAAA